jgi:hypothetical protein
LSAFALSFVSPEFKAEAYTYAVMSYLNSGKEQYYGLFFAINIEGLLG